MQETKYITILSNKKEVVVSVSAILYVFMKRNNAEIHVSGDKVYKVRMTLLELNEKLGDGFIMVHRSILVSAMAIHDISDKIYLSNRYGRRCRSRLYILQHKGCHSKPERKNYCKEYGKC